MTLHAIDGLACAPASPPARNPPGLTSVEADRRRATQGGNALPDVGDHPLARVVEKFWSPVPWMLEGAIVLELALSKYIEAAVIGLLLVFNAVLGYVQEGRAQATLAALKSRLAVTASARRNGAWKCPLPTSWSEMSSSLTLGGAGPRGRAHPTTARSWSINPC